MRGRHALIPGGLTTLTLMLVGFVMWHAGTSLGARLAIAFFVSSAAVSWAFEQVGVSTGLVYGHYRYTGALGPLLGGVPILIPCAWFVLAYPSYLAANLILDRRPFGTSGDRGHLVALSLLGAFLMAAWDLLADPILSGPEVRAWIWEPEGAHVGVPMQNYAGWLATTFAVFVLYRSLERRWRAGEGPAIGGSAAIDRPWRPAAADDEAS